MSMRKVLLCLLACSWAFLGSSCGAGTAALVGLLSRKGASKAASAPTVVSDVHPVQGPVGFKTSPLSFSFRLTDAESDPADVEVLYLLPGESPVLVLVAGGDER